MELFLRILRTAPFRFAPHLHTICYLHRERRAIKKEEHKHSMLISCNLACGVASSLLVAGLLLFCICLGVTGTRGLWLRACDGEDEEGSKGLGSRGCMLSCRR